LPRKWASTHFSWLYFHIILFIATHASLNAEFFIQRLIHLTFLKRYTQLSRCNN
jgi:hypothetical protein